MGGALMQNPLLAAEHTCSTAMALCCLPDTEAASRPAGPPPPPPDNTLCKRLLWFTSLSLPHHENLNTTDYTDYLQVALLSALRNAPSLIPVLVYDGPACPLTAWFESMGGLVVFHHLSIYKELREAEAQGHVRPGYADFVRGTYLRLDIPFLLPKVVQHVGHSVEDANFLYTDADVMFFDDIDSCSLPQPRVVLMGPEFQRGRPGNAGVLYIHGPGLRQALPELLHYARGRHWDLEAADQTLLLQGLGTAVELLPDTFNYKGYYGTAQGVRLVHFHGPKPLRCLPCYLRYPEHYKESCVGDCGGLVNVLSRHVHDKGSFYRKLLQVWMRLWMEVKASQNRGSETVMLGSGDGVTGGGGWMGDMHPVGGAHVRHGTTRVL